METGIIKKARLAEVIESLKQMGKVTAPVRQDDQVVFSPLSGGEEIDLDYANSKLSPKGCFFPQTEVLFYYQKDNHKISPPAQEDKRVNYLLGIRPCDARALVLLDHVFDEATYKDVYYLTRRNNTVMIGLACNQPQAECFCTSTGGSPFDTSGLDMLWQDLGDRYLLKAVTEKGKTLLKQLPQVEKVNDEDSRHAKALQTEALASLPSVFQADTAAKTLSSSFDDPRWQMIKEKCLGCAACAFVCPTCHCFDIQDENTKGEGRRVRLWDSCMFPLFTLHTSGHNPRPSGKERIRQRVMHKFFYFKENNGQIACVGCGRCIRECPVNMDIRQIVSLFC